MRSVIAYKVKDYSDETDSCICRAAVGLLSMRVAREPPFARKTSKAHRVSRKRDRGEVRSGSRSAHEEYPNDPSPAGHQKRLAVHIAP